MRRPGRYPFERGLTVGRLLEAAGGLLRTGSERVILRRPGAEVEADLGDIRDGKAADPALAPGDEVVVRERRL